MKRRRIEIAGELTEQLSDEILLIALEGKGSHLAGEGREECKALALGHLADSSFQELWGGAVALLIGLFEAEDVRSHMNLPEEDPERIPADPKP